MLHIMNMLPPPLDNSVCDQDPPESTWPTINFCFQYSFIIDTNGSGKISFRQFYDFICHHDSATDISLLVKQRPVNQDMEEEIADELGVVWMQIMMHLHEHSAGAVVDLDGGMQTMIDDLYASAVSHGVVQEEGVCAQKDFISVFEKYGLMSIMSKNNITLLFRVFGIGESLSMMNIHAFISWLQAEGIDMTTRQGAPLITPVASPLAQKINALEKEEIHSASSKRTVHDLSPDCNPSKISFNKLTLEGKVHSQLIRENVEICVTICNKTFIATSGIVSKDNANIITYNMKWDTVEMTEKVFLDPSAVLVVSVKSSEDGVSASGSVKLKDFMVPIGSAFIVSLLVKNMTSPRGEKSRGNWKDSDADQAVKVTLYGTVQDRKSFSEKEYSEESIENSSREIRGNLFMEGNICHSAPSSSLGLSKQFHEIHTEVISEIQDSTKEESSRNGSLKNIENSPTITDHFLNNKGISGKDIPTIVSGLDIVTKPIKKIVRENIEGVKGERQKSEGSIENPMYVLANNHSVANENFKKEEHLTESSSSGQEEVVILEQGAKESDMVLMITSVGTTQADEDNEDDYEVDFEDFVED